MATIGYAELPVPGGGDAPTWPAALADLAAAIDPHLVQHVADLAERNAELAGAPVHTVAAAADGTVWKKTSTGNTWVTWWEPRAAWRPLSLASGYQANTLAPQVSIRTGQVHLRGRLARIDGGLIVGTNSIQIATVPTDCIPQQVATSSAYYSLTGDPVVGAGRCEVQPVGGSPAGALTFWSQDGAQDGGTVGCAWVDISGSYWLD